MNGTFVELAMATSSAGKLVSFLSIPLWTPM